MPKIELNGVANALAILETGGNIEDAIIQLRLFSRYIREFEREPIMWHDFLKRF